MAVLEVLKFPDPRLRKKCVDVEEVNDEVRSFAKDMLETMYSFRGIGLAAAQVNRQIRVITLDCRPRDEGRYLIEEMTELEQQVPQPLTMINPVIVVREGKTQYEEGCLSVPSYYELVDRYEYIEVEYLDLNGEKKLVKTDGLLSICIQHEIDHLDGKLFIDRLTPIRSTRIRNKIKKGGYPEIEPGELDEQQQKAITEELVP